MIVLLVLAEAWSGGKVRFYSVYEALFALNFFLSLGVFIGHIRFDISDGAFKEFFTLHMIYTGGIVPTIFIMLLYVEILKYRIKNVSTDCHRALPDHFWGSTDDCSACARSYQFDW